MWTAFQMKAAQPTFAWHCPSVRKYWSRFEI